MIDLRDRPAPVRARPHPPVNLGGDDDFIAPGEILHCAAEDLFAAAERVPVRRVEEIDAALERPFDKGTALLLTKAPGMIAAIGDTVAHAAEADP